jgi:hypothetical protein
MLADTDAGNRVTAAQSVVCTIVSAVGIFGGLRALV